MGRKSKPAALAEQAADSVTDAAAQLKSSAADAASQLRSAAHDTAQQAAEVASEQLNEKRGRSGVIFALLVLVAGAVIWWRTQQS